MTDKHQGDDVTDKDDMLASEYALGILEGEQKRLAVRRFDDDLAFRGLVEDWQMRLSPLQDEVTQVAPPAKVWNDIEARVMPAETKSIWKSLNFWRGFSLVSSAIAAVAMVFIVSTNEVTTDKQLLVASLTATGDAPAFLAKYDAATGALIISAGFDQAQVAKVAELWLIPADGVPRSLGLLSADGNARVMIAAQLKPDFAKDGTLAVSLEPLGGSPTGAPTGPVIASGKLKFL